MSYFFVLFPSELFRVDLVMDCWWYLVMVYMCNLECIWRL